MLKVNPVKKKFLLIAKQDGSCWGFSVICWTEYSHEGVVRDVLKYLVSESQTLAHCQLYLQDLVIPNASGTPTCWFHQNARAY